MFVQPLHERIVVCETAKQAHSAVAMGVDQAGQERVARKPAMLRGRNSKCCFPLKDSGNASLAHCQAVPLQDLMARDNGHNPLRMKNEIDGVW